MKHLWLLLIVGGLPMSCLSFEKSIKPTAESRHKSWQSLGGIYQNAPAQIGEVVHYDESIGGTSDIQQKLLFNQFDFVSAKPDADTAANLLVQLVPLNKHTLLLHLIHGSDTLKTKKLKGEYRDGYFYRRKQLIIAPFFPVLFGFRGQRQRIGIEGDQLVVGQRKNMWVSFLIAGRSENYQQEIKYRKAARK